MKQRLVPGVSAEEALELLISTVFNIFDRKSKTSCHPQETEDELVETTEPVNKRFEQQQDIDGANPGIRISYLEFYKKRLADWNEKVQIFSFE